MDDKEPKSIKEQELEYLGELSGRRGGRALAIVALVFLAVLFAATIVMGILKSRYFMGMLALCILCPIGIYIFLWLGRVLRSRNS